jgi:hypothetical protein
MKWLIVSCLGLSLVGCGGGASSSDTTSANSSVPASDAAVHGHHTVMSDCYVDGKLSSCAVEVSK